MGRRRERPPKLDIQHGLRADHVHGLQLKISPYRKPFQPRPTLGPRGASSRQVRREFEPNLLFLSHLASHGRPKQPNGQRLQFNSLACELPDSLQPLGTARSRSDSRPRSVFKMTSVNVGQNDSVSSSFGTVSYATF